MPERKSAARQAEKTVSELSGITREFAHQRADFSRNVSDRTTAIAEGATKAAREAYSTLAGAVDFHRPARIPT